MVNKIRLMVTVRKQITATSGLGCVRTNRRATIRYGITFSRSFKWARRTRSTWWSSITMFIPCGKSSGLTKTWTRWMILRFTENTIKTTTNLLLEPQRTRIKAHQHHFDGQQRCVGGIDSKHRIVAWQQFPRGHCTGQRNVWGFFRHVGSAKLPNCITVWNPHSRMRLILHRRITQSSPRTNGLLISHEAAVDKGCACELAIDGHWLPWELRRLRLKEIVD